MNPASPAIECCSSQYNSHQFRIRIVTVRPWESRWPWALVGQAGQGQGRRVIGPVESGRSRELTVEAHRLPWPSQ